MDVSAYVGRRVLFKFWDCEVVKNNKFEIVYRELDEYYKLFKDFGADELSKIHIQKRNEKEDAIYDLKKVYVDLAQNVNDFHSLRNLRLMFVTTKLFLKVYHENPIISAQIVFEFQNMSFRSNCWNDMIKQFDQGNRLCILL